MMDKLSLAVAAGAIGAAVLAVCALRAVVDDIDATFAEPFGDVPNTNHVQSDSVSGVQQNGD